MIAGGNHTITYGFGARERDFQRPLCRLLFALFLPKQEKGNKMSLKKPHRLVRLLDY